MCHDKSSQVPVSTLRLVPNTWMLIEQTTNKTIDNGTFVPGTDVGVIHHCVDFLIEVVFAVVLADVLRHRLPGFLGDALDVILGENTRCRDKVARFHDADVNTPSLHLVA